MRGQQRCDVKEFLVTYKPGGSRVQKHLFFTVMRFELHFTLSLWASGSCDLTERYSCNHLFCQCHPTHGLVSLPSCLRHHLPFYHAAIKSRFPSTTSSPNVPLQPRSINQDVPSLCFSKAADPVLCRDSCE